MLEESTFKPRLVPKPSLAMQPQVIDALVCALRRQGAKLAFERDAYAFGYCDLHDKTDSQFFVEDLKVVNRQLAIKLRKTKEAYLELTDENEKLKAEVKRLKDLSSTGG